MKRIIHYILIISASLLLTACEQPQNTATQTETSPAPAGQETASAPTGAVHPDAHFAVAELQPTAGNQASGRVEFTQVPEGVRVVAQLQGLTGKHGIHVHEFGDCSDPEAESAGEHFNPHDTPHGGPDSPHQERHAGDLGNIEADGDGRGLYDRVDHVIQLSGPDSILGRSVVVHAEEDDLTSQPAGDAGDRIACGVIRQVPH